MMWRQTLGVVALPDDRGLVGAGGEVAVDAVGRDVERAVLEPLDRDVVVVEGGVLDPGVGLDPVEPLALLAPERVRVGDRGRVHGGVALGVRRAPSPRSRPEVGAADQALASPSWSELLSPGAGNGRPAMPRSIEPPPPIVKTRAARPAPDCRRDRLRGRVAARLTLVGPPPLPSAKRRAGPGHQADQSSTRRMSSSDQPRWWAISCTSTCRTSRSRRTSPRSIHSSRIGRR